jgi:hypothetical protein
MRILCAFLLLAALGLRAGGIVVATPAVPLKGTVVTLTLIANPLPVGGIVNWDFGDGTQATKGTVVTNFYPNAGFYTVRATYTIVGSNVPQVASIPLHVVGPTGPAAPFTVSALRLRWEDGRTDQSVDRDFTPLVAFADLKFEGTGLLQAQWLVDGVPVGTFVQQLAFANAATFDTRSLLPLPTTSPGEHFVSLRFLSPVVTFPVPRIRYFVRSEAQDPPRVETVLPSVLAPGQEMELWLTGKGLVKGVRIHFGRGVALVAPLRFPEPGRAVAKVFVSPTAREGVREVQVVGPTGHTHGPATLQILPPPPPQESKPPEG